MLIRNSLNMTTLGINFILCYIEYNECGHIKPVWREYVDNLIIGIDHRYILETSL